MMHFKFAGIAVLLGMAWTVPALAQATTTTTNTTVPISDTFTNAFCPAAEPVAISGEVHSLIHTTIDAGGGFHITIHFNNQGVSGTGVTTGAQYQLTEQLTFHFNTRGPFPQEVAQVNRLVLSGQGPSNNMLGKFTVHVTINANGETTVSFGNFSFECDK